MDGFPEDLLEVVNDHWGKFPPAHPMIVSFFGTFYLLVTMVCVLGNGLLIYVFLSAKHLRTPVSSKVSKVKLIAGAGALSDSNSLASSSSMFTSLLAFIT